MVRHVTKPISMIGGAVAAFCCILVLFGSQAHAADLCVTPGGAGGCYATIQAAVSAAGGGDTIRVMAGIYTENVTIDTSVTLLGGYDDNSFAGRTPRTSIVDGGGLNTVFRIANGAAVIVDGFTIRNGNGTANDGRGGGIAVVQATVQIVNNLIEKNIANTDPARNGYGGGISVMSDTQPVLITGNTIRQNVAYSLPAGSANQHAGAGGGIMLDLASSGIISDNQIESNVAARTGDFSSQAAGYGGGVSISAQRIVLENNVIQDNLGLDAGLRGGGGGVLVYNTALVTITRNTIQHNLGVGSAASAEGGGVLLAGVGVRYVLAENFIVSNTTVMTLTGASLFAGGGGVRVWGGNAEDDELVMHDNRIIGNVTAVTVANLNGDTVEGGALSVGRVSTVRLDSEEIRGNVAGVRIQATGAGGWGGNLSGGGAHIWECNDVAVENSRFEQNITVQDMTAVGVGTHSSGGGLSVDNSTHVLLRSNQIVRNTVVQLGSMSGNDWNFGVSGGGVSVSGNDTSDDLVTVENNQIADNIGAGQMTRTGSDSQTNLDGGGLSIREISTTAIISNLVHGNSAVIRLVMSGDGTDKWGGRASGGGIYLGESNDVTVERNDIRNNVAAWEQTVSNVHAGASGGGIGMDNVKAVVIRQNVVVANTALLSGSMASNVGENFGQLGGGIQIDGHQASDDRITIENNQLQDNVASGTLTVNGANVQSNPEGGALDIRNLSSAVVVSNVVQGNTAVVLFSMTGGGTDKWGGRAAGGGLYLSGNEEVTVERNDIRNNVAARQQTVQGAETGSQGGGIVIDNFTTAAIRQNVVAANRAVITGSIRSDVDEHFDADGGGMRIKCDDDQPACTAVIVDNTITDNITAGIIAETGSDPSSRAHGGGMSLHHGTMTVRDNTLRANRALVTGLHSEGGAIFLDGSTVAMAQNTILTNVTGPDAGVQAVIWVWQATLRTYNDVFAQNSGGIGVGMNDEAASLVVVNDTFYANGKTAVWINNAATASVTNTIIVEHENGLERQGANATLTGDYNLLDNQTNYDSVAPGAHDLTGQDPSFADAAGNDFHLTAGSPALDAGVNPPAPAVDFEDDPRPLDGNYDGVAIVDIGADEWVATGSMTYLPAVFR